MEFWPFCKRFIIYIEFSTNLVQSRGFSSIRLEMAQGKVKTHHFENDEKFNFSFFCYLPMTSNGQRRHFSRFTLLVFISYNASWRSHLPDWQGCNSSTEREWFEHEDHCKESREERATSVARLKKIACKVWRQVTLECLNKHYKSMPRRMQAVIQAQGSHTKY